MSHSGTLHLCSLIQGLPSFHIQFQCIKVQNLTVKYPPYKIPQFKCPNPLLPEEILDGGFTAFANMACALKKLQTLMMSVFYDVLFPSEPFLKKKKTWHIQFGFHVK